MIDGIVLAAFLGAVVASVRNFVVFRHFEGDTALATVAAAVTFVCVASTVLVGGEALRADTAHPVLWLALTAGLIFGTISAVLIVIEDWPTDAAEPVGLRHGLRHVTPGVDPGKTPVQSGVSRCKSENGSMGTTTRPDGGEQP